MGKKLTDQQVFDGVKALFDQAKMRYITIEALAIDVGTWERVTRAADHHTFTSQGGDCYLFGYRVLFSTKPGLQVLYKTMTQALAIKNNA